MGRRETAWLFTVVTVSALKCSEIYFIASYLQRRDGVYYNGLKSADLATI